MRASGILMHITSLPGPYGIGTMGREAYKFVDFLQKAGQKFWQLLPLTPTGYGDSPYQSCSTFAGNHYLIDLELLTEAGLLKKEELASVDWGVSDTRIDFGRLYSNRLNVLRIAYSRFQDRDEAFAKFRACNDSWLPEFAHYMALKDRFGGKPWYEWPDPMKYREKDALCASFCALAEEIRFYCFVQYLFFTQWQALRDYAHQKDICIIGDVPIYVPYDSVEVWCAPDLFDLDAELNPVAVAGCPPDGFNADGQLWGNPLYRWDAHKSDGYRWWLRRLSGAASRYDMIRIDHFRGFAGYFTIPFGAENARNGKWLPGPGLDFLQAVKTQLPDVPMIAEDLGHLTEDVHSLRQASGWPGMKVISFAFDGNADNPYLPYNHIRNSVCYTGTHDNMPLKQWLAQPREAALAKEYMGAPQDMLWGLIRLCLSSVSDLAVVQIQDYLELGEEGRMNFPGTRTDSNWTWRAESGFARDALAQRIAELTHTYGRA